MIVTRKSIISGYIYNIELDVTQEQLDLYASGNHLIQDVFPKLKPDEREFIKSGIPSREWNEMFKDVSREWNEIFKDVER